jgi:hypothetical protein
MLSRLKPRLTYANVMATIAVFGVLGGGGAYAANEWNGSNIQDGTLTGADIQDLSLGLPDYGANSISTGKLKDQDVRTQDLRDLGVTNPKIAWDSVSSGKVIDGSLLRQDFRAGELPQAPKSFNEHVEPASGTSTSNTVATANGLVLSGRCENTSTPRVGWFLTVQGGGTLYVVGTATFDYGSPRSVNIANQAAGFVSSTTVDLNIIAMTPNVGKWTSFQIGSYRGPVATGSACNHNGIVIPGA